MDINFPGIAKKVVCTTHIVLWFFGSPVKWQKCTYDYIALTHELSPMPMGQVLDSLVYIFGCNIMEFQSTMNFKVELLGWWEKYYFTIEIRAILPDKLRMRDAAEMWGPSIIQTLLSFNGYKILGFRMFTCLPLSACKCSFFFRLWSLFHTNTADFSLQSVCK